MKNRFLCHSRYVLGLLVLLFSFSFSLGVVYAQDFNSQRGMNGKFAEKAAIFLKNHPRFRAAIKAHKLNQARLMDMHGVVAAGVGTDPNGEPVVKIFTSRAGIGGIPKILDGVPVRVKVSGRIYALSDSKPPLWRPRPVPIGVSTGHPNITAGSIGARVKDASGKVYALSNNHVYADINNGIKGVDPVLQPGAADDGTLDDVIGILDDFEPIEFCYYWWFWLICPETNTIDAAVALCTEDDLGFATPLESYGAPNSTIHPAYGEPSIFGDENLGVLLGQGVQKHGRTTALTVGTVDAINATVNVCYDDFCDNVARFVDQIILKPGSFSAGGDSGSLIVTNDQYKYPVALLFAGSETETIANRIDLVLDRFNVTIDSGDTLPFLTIDDANVTEGDEGTADVVFTVTLSDPSSEVVYVDYATADGSATAGEDYQAASGTVTFSPGTTTGTITVTVNGDSDFESDEVFYVNLSDAANAIIEDDQGEGTIVNNDAPPPAALEITIDNASVTEGDTGTADVVFTVSLSAPSTSEVTVSFSSTSEGADPAATEGEDYDAASGTLTFTPPTTTQTITVAVNGDSEFESDEIFYVDLFNATSATILDDRGVGTIINDDAPEPASGPLLQTGQVLAGTDRWETVLLDHDYGGDMVVVCTPNYDEEDPSGFFKIPVVVQVQVAIGNSFQVRLAPAVAATFETREAWVHWMVVKRGVYNVAEHGIKMEAEKFVSTVTDRAGSWAGEPRDYANDYTNPVVVGQVMTFSSAWWSTFWSRGSSSKNPPSTDSLWVGKHSGEDSRTRANEIIGYIVIEAGEGNIEGTNYEAGLGSDTIRGVGDSPPYTYSLNGLSFTPSTAVVSQAAMDGGNGGWAILYWDDPVTASALKLAIDEDWYRDSERRHTSEQVAYILIE